jgi:hypothetical protein
MQTTAVASSAVIDPQTGALAAGGVTAQIGPSMTQAAFLASKWGQSAIDADGGGYKGGFYPPPWRYWTLAGKYSSMSLSLAVTLHFLGEQLVRLELWHDDGKKSWVPSRPPTNSDGSKATRPGCRFASGSAVPFPGGRSRWGMAPKYSAAPRSLLPTVPIQRIHSDRSAGGRIPRYR